MRPFLPNAETRASSRAGVSAAAVIAARSSLRSCSMLSFISLSLGAQKRKGAARVSRPFSHTRCDERNLSSERGLGLLHQSGEGLGLLQSQIGKDLTIQLD